MIAIKIPGADTLNLNFLVLDFNGTLALDGKIIGSVIGKLNKLTANLEIHVITADTFGKAKEQLLGTNCIIRVLEKKSDQQLQKKEYIEKLGKKNVVAIGNGRNDALMLKHAALGIAIIQKEGAASETLFNADLICTDILDAIDLLENPLRLVATLRK